MTLTDELLLEEVVAGLIRHIMLGESTSCELSCRMCALLCAVFFQHVGRSVIARWHVLVEFSTAEQYHQNNVGGYIVLSLS